MDALLTSNFLTAFLSGILMVCIPLLLASLGEQISEKAGVLNLGLEGMMLGGDYTGFVCTFYNGS